MRKEKITSTIILLILCLHFSCGFEDLGKVEDVAVVSNAKFIVPLAYGEIDIETVIDYTGLGTNEFERTSDGYYILDYSLREFETGDTLALSNSLPELISRLELRIETENRLPLGISFSVSFYDSISAARLGPPIEIDFIVPPETDSEGKVIAPSNHIQNIALAAEHVNQLKNANGIILNVFLYLPERKSQELLIHPSDYFSLNIGAIVDLSTNNAPD
ncbi:MAG: hypothetical protein K9H26_06300 [Prolixibacteraceae bacterium]|nr:hypothetical protein [Prolixibacteraceae bacterium]